MIRAKGQKKTPVREFQFPRKRTDLFATVMRKEQEKQDEFSPLEILQPEERRQSDMRVSSVKAPARAANKHMI